VVGKISKDFKQRGFLLSLLIILQAYAIIAFAPSGLYQLLHNDITLSVKDNMTLITLEYVFAATFLITTFFLLMGILLWSRKMAIFFLIFSFAIVFFEYFLHRQSLSSLPTLALPLLWTYAVLKKWSFFR
jgi:hypothetical protein